MAEKKPIHVVIIDDHIGVRLGLRNILERNAGFRIVGEGGNGWEAIKMVDDQNPDIVLLDVELPFLRGDEVMKRIRLKHPGMKVLAVSSYDDRAYIQAMLDNGASGYLLKEDAPELLVEAVRGILRGNKTWLSPRIER
jgi:DNA-binding NarL/FixJ family response regulator